MISAMFIKPADLDIIKKLNLKHPYVWLSTWFGAGFLRPAPGTWGSALSIPVALIIYQASGFAALIMATLSIFILGYWAAHRFEQATQSHDNSMIVIDEAVGQWITLLPVLYVSGLSPLWIVLAFGLFRLFDITKPWPVSYCDQQLKGPLSVMLDDVVAGIMAALIIMGIHYAGFG